MKLKSLRLTNLLSHEDAHIELGEFLTVFTGVSESGKSGIVRGINQLFRNRPAGIDLLRHAAKRGACSEIEATLEHDGRERSIVRRRGKSKNEYELDGQPLIAFGLEVPEEVSKLLNLSPNAFQLQGARPPDSKGNFLLCETDGEVARVLSSTVGLAQIDAAFTEVRKCKNENDTDLRVSQADLEREQATAEKFGGFTTASELVTCAGNLDGACTEANETACMMEQDANSLSSLRPDESGLASGARILFSAADKFERARSQACLDLDEMSQSEAALAAIREVASTKPANLALVAFTGAFELLDGEKAALGSMALALDNLLLLRKDIGIAPRRAALLLTQAETAVGNKTSAIAAMEEMITALSRCEGLRGSRLPDIAATEEHLSVAAAATRKLQEEEKELECLSAALANLLVIEYNVLTLGANLKFAVSEIENYKREHPVCPECGAEQKHWHKGECYGNVERTTEPACRRERAQPSEQ